MRVIKDLVLDLTHVFAQYEMIEPWLHSQTPDPEKERLQSRKERGELDFAMWPILYNVTPGDRYFY